LCAIIKQVENGKDLVVVVAGNRDRTIFNPGLLVIVWNLHAAAITADGIGLSPALLLGHEFGHAAGGNLARSLLDHKVPGFDNLEEQRVIMDIERPAARSLNEGIRSDHANRGVSWVPKVIDHAILEAP
jgi:hypothetical protein